MPRDLINLDPADPPEGADEVEQLLWRGRCPWCGESAGFYPSEEFDDSLICANCGVEFNGPQDNDPAVPEQRWVDKVFVLGDGSKMGGLPDSLPTRIDRPPRGS